MVAASCDEKVKQLDEVCAALPQAGKIHKDLRRKLEEELLHLRI